MAILGVVFGLFVAITSAQAAPQKGISDDALKQRVIEHNQRQSVEQVPLRPLGRPGVSARPFAEYEDTGYLIFSDEFDFSSYSVKREMLRNLPEGVQAIVFTGYDDSETRKNIIETFTDVIDISRLHVVYMPGGSRGFWARDGVPIPVRLTTADDGLGLRLVDARYYHGFEADAAFARLFGAELTSHTYYYEGGNFMPNHLGDCLTVDNDLSKDIPAEIFSAHYGCKKLIRLPYAKGIGHVDESVRFVDGDTVFTDEATYVETLKQNGYEVILLPRPDRYYETYVNSLLINGTVYVPTFGGSKDQEALQVYRSQGWKVVPVDSFELSNYGLGSVHCITMTYPKGPLNRVVQALGGRLL